MFTNKGEKTVRLFDDFYPLKDNGPHISIEIFWKLTKEKKEKVAAYYPHYCIERGQFLNFITLKPEQQEWLDSVLSHCLKITLGSRL